MYIENDGFDDKVYLLDDEAADKRTITKFICPHCKEEMYYRINKEVKIDAITCDNCGAQI